MLLICYTPGARGDFLASVLLNVKFKNQPIIFTPPNYRKVHWIDNFTYKDFVLDSAELSNYSPKIRIGCQTDLDFAKLIYRRYSKPPLTTNPFIEGELTSCLRDEIANRKYDSQFDYVISVEFFEEFDNVRQLYRQIHGHEIGTSTLKNLCLANIELNRCVGQAWDEFLIRYKTELKNFEFPWPDWVKRIIT